MMLILSGVGGQNVVKQKDGITAMGIYPYEYTILTEKGSDSWTEVVVPAAPEGDD
jgi:hypothetical protein